MSEIRNVLMNDFSYFRKLSEGEKGRFEKRVKEFMEDRSFDGRKDFEVTEKVKILISATAVQLTFGHQYYFFEHFKKIIIYPEKYYSKYDQRYHLGEAHSMGVVVLSWKDFYEGIRIDSDAKNVGLHEFAHALFLSEVLGRFKDDYFSDYIEKWIAVGRLYLNRIKESDTYFFRKYATTNIQELFAVGIEYFFERPEDFQKNEPDFYRVFSILLRQDPLSPDNKFSYATVFKGAQCDFLSLREKAHRSKPLSTNFYIILFFAVAIGLMILMTSLSPGLKFVIWLPILIVAGKAFLDKAAHETYVLLDVQSLFENIYSKSLLTPLFDLIISLDYFQYESEDDGTIDAIKIIYADFDSVTSTIITFAGDPEELFTNAYYHHKIATFKFGKKYIPALPEKINGQS